MTPINPGQRWTNARTGVTVLVLSTDHVSISGRRTLCVSYDEQGKRRVVDHALFRETHLPPGMSVRMDTWQQEIDAVIIDDGDVPKRRVPVAIPLLMALAVGSGAPPRARVIPQPPRGRR